MCGISLNNNNSNCTCEMATRRRRRRRERELEGDSKCNVKRPRLVRAACKGGGVCGVYVCVFITRVIKLSVVARNEHVSATHIDNSNKSREERQQRNKRRSRGSGRRRSTRWEHGECVSAHVKSHSPIRFDWGPTYVDVCID